MDEREEYKVDDASGVIASSVSTDTSGVIDTGKSADTSVIITADNITTLRFSMNLSRSRFARACGYSANYMESVESGRYKVSDRLVEKICETYGVSREELACGQWDKNRDHDTTVAAEACDTHTRMERAARVKEVRLSSGETLRSFASRLKASTNSVQKIEAGKQKLTKNYAKKLEDEFDVSMDWLLYGDELSKEWPIGDKMIGYLKGKPEVRKLVWERMMEDQENTPD